MASKTDQLYKHIIVLLKVLNTITQYLVGFPLTYTIYVVHTLSVIRGVMLNTRNKKILPLCIMFYVTKTLFSFFFLFLFHYTDFKKSQ